MSKTCKNCRYWSELIAKQDGGKIVAYCLATIGHSQLARHYTAGNQTCEAWAHNKLGAIDEPDNEPTRYDDLDDDE